MAGERIETIISAVDDFSATMNRYKQALGESEAAATAAAHGTEKLSKQIASLTDANDWAVGGVKKLKNILQGMAFGSTIGAVAAITNELISAAQAAFNTAEELAKLESSITSQATAWNLLPSPIGNATAATVAYYNAELRLMKLLSEGKAEKLKERQTELEMREVGVMSLLRGTTRQLAEQDKELASVNLQLERHNALMKLEEMTLEGVTAALQKKTAGLKTITKETNEAAAGIELPTFVMERIRMTEEGLKADPPSLTVPLFLNWTMLSAVTGMSDEPSSAVREQAEELIAKMELAGGPKVQGGVGGSQEFSEATQLNSRLKEMEEYYTERLDLMRLLGYSEVEINEVKNQQILAQEQQLAYLRMSLVQGSFAMMSNMMQNLTVITGKEGGTAFKAMKAFAIAETTIQTYRAAQGAYAALAPIPVVGPALAIAAATAATVAGMARVKQIQSMEPGGSAIGSTISAGGTANPPYSGGSPSAYPVPTRSEEIKPSQHITLIIQNPLNGQIADSAAEAIIDLINKGGDMNYKINARVIQSN